MQIKLVNTGTNKLNVIKVLRQITDLPLEKCKAISETPNSVVKIKDGLNTDLLSQIFQKIGVKIEIIETNENTIEFQPQNQPKVNSNNNEQTKKFRLVIKSFSDKLTAIKLLRNFTQLPLSVLNNHTEKLPAAFDIETTLNNMVAFKNLAGQNNIVADFNEVETKTVNFEQVQPQSNNKIFKFFLTSSGSNKIQVIKILRDFTDAPLYESKKFVDFTPSIFFVKCTIETANNYLNKLRSAGATVSYDIVENVGIGNTLYDCTSDKKPVAETPKQKNVIHHKKEEQPVKEKNTFKDIDFDKVHKKEQKTIVPPKKEERPVEKTSSEKMQSQNKQLTNVNSNHSQQINEKQERLKQLLREKVKAQNVTKGVIYSVIWIEVISLALSFLYFKIFWIMFPGFIIAGIISGSVFKNQGKIIEAKHRISGAALTFFCYLQTVITIIIVFNIQNQFDRFIIPDVFNPTIISGAIIGLFLSFILSVKKTELSLIKNELNSLDKRETKTQKKRLADVKNNESYNKFSKSAHKDKYSSKKKDRKF